MTPVEEYRFRMRLIRKAERRRFIADVWPFAAMGLACGIIMAACAWDRIDPRSQAPSADYPCGPMYNCCFDDKHPRDACLIDVYRCMTPGKPGGGCETIPQNDVPEMKFDGGR